MGRQETALGREGEPKQLVAALCLKHTEVMPILGEKRGVCAKIDTAADYVAGREGWAIVLSRIL